MHAGIVGTAPGSSDDEIDDAVARFADGEARYLGIGARSGLSCFRAALGANLARHGRVTEAESWVAAARDELDRHGERWPEPLVLLAEGVVAAVVGERDVARMRFDAAERVALERAAPVLSQRVAAERAEFGC
jgi:hypothetical protein